jgi:hypothetical protein
MPPDRADDAYTIYSLLVTTDFPTSLMENQPQWLIADTTLVAGEEWVSPHTGISAPYSQRQDFAPVLEDYDKNKYLRVHLEKEFHLPLPYQLLDKRELAEYQKLKLELEAAQEGSLPPKYQGAPGLIYFSNVYFNFDHTLALVYMAEWCGKQCGEMRWVALAKRDGGWGQLNWNAEVGRP